MTVGFRGRGEEFGVKRGTRHQRENALGPYPASALAAATVATGPPAGAAGRN